METDVATQHDLDDYLDCFSRPSALKALFYLNECTEPITRTALAKSIRATYQVLVKDTDLLVALGLMEASQHQQGNKRSITCYKITAPGRYVVRSIRVGVDACIRARNPTND